jgi:WD40 repeat protein
VIKKNKTTSILSGCILLLLTLLLLTQQPPQQWKEPIKAACNEAWALAFTPDNRYLLVAGDTGTKDNNEAVIEHVTVIDLKTGKKQSFPTQHDAMIKSIAVVDGGNTLITSSYDGSVGEYDWKTGTLRKQHWSIRSQEKDRNVTLNKNEISAMGISVDEESIGVGTNVNSSGFSSLHVKNRRTNVVKSLPQTTNCNVIQILFPQTFQAGHLLFTCSPIDKIFYWDITQPAFSSKWDLKQAIHNIAISPRGDTIATALSNNNIAISRWPGMELQTELKGHTCEIRKIAFSPDGRWLASTDIAGTIVWWDLKRSIRRATFDSGVRINAVQFSPDGEWLAIGQHDGHVSLFSTSNFQR